MVKVRRSKRIREKSAESGVFAPNSRNIAPALKSRPKYVAMADKSKALCIREALRALAGLSVPMSRITVAQWSNGTRIAPIWFVRLLADRLLAQECILRDIRERLSQYPRARGHGAGLTEYWKERKAIEAGDRRAIERAEQRRKILSGSAE